MLRVVPLLLALVVLAGCGGQETNFSGATPSLGPGDSVAGTVLADVLAVAEPRPGRFRITLRTVGDAEGCVSKPQVRRQFDDNSPAHLQAVYESTGSATCRSDGRSVVRRAVPGRPTVLVVNQESWRPGPGTSWVRCSETLGCNPPADRCDRAWIDDLLARSDLPPERRVDVVSCGGGRLQLNVDAVPTGCPTIEGADPPAGCKGSGVHAQWVATLDSDQRWRVVSSVARGAS